MKKTVFSLAFLVGTLAFLLAAVSPARAESITVYSSPATTTAASVAGTQGAGFDQSLTTQLTSGSNQSVYLSGLTFSPALYNIDGTFTHIPIGAPIDTQVVNLPGSVSGYPWGVGPSGFFLDTFMLPINFSNASLSGAGCTDDGGYVFLNGNLINIGLSEYNTTYFSDSTQTHFVAGINQLVIADNNFGGQPSGAAFYATISYTTGGGPAPAPEPTTMLLLGLGLVGLAGVKRKFKK
jgi:hypothetical protein